MNSGAQLFTPPLSRLSAKIDRLVRTLWKLSQGLAESAEYRPFTAEKTGKKLHFYSAQSLRPRGAERWVVHADTRANCWIPAGFRPRVQGSLYGYDALVDANSPRPFVMERASKSSGGSFRRKNIEGFLNFAQHRLQKFNGVPNRTFYLHMKESEWRFNHSDTELYRELLKLIESNPL